MFMNSNLFEPGKSKLERNFIQSAAKQNTRLDGRKSGDFRDVKLTFGADWGTVIVAIGDTKVLAQVSCDIGTPSSARPNEGTLHLNVSLGGVAYLNESQTTHDQRFLTLNSLLERTFRNSRSLDLESLCVAAEQHVWCVRVDITVLNHDGNLYDASTVAALAALMHFRRPDVTFLDEEIRIYSDKERELIPLLFLHYPVSVTYCLYKSNSHYPYVDPILLEENAADSIIVLSFNSYNELCSLNAGGSTPTKAGIIMQCARNAAKRSKSLVDFLKKALLLDEQRRNNKEPIMEGLVSLLTNKSQTISYNHLMKEDVSDIVMREKQEIPEKVKTEDKPVAVDAEPHKKPSKATPAPINDSAWLPRDKEASPTVVTSSAPTKTNRNKSQRGAGQQKSTQKHSKQQNQSDSEEETKPVIK
ncbi:uncharacterized protein Dwil_GK14785 [Drosophila willistoni]|uniref:Exosome complex component RRP45 n=1 Tax=Drosophila willistoni TaxID=7260 RepID=B4NPN8_DROWI|nr:exosome complex component RRP45 [Drosophila willistoni]EDW86478.1 uncharacterized protein Dwil_GK14785 [Drosophila willistoni]